MADETTTATETAEPQISINDPNFGNLEEAFDKAFPATAPKDEKEASATPAEPVKTPEPPKPPPEPAKPPVPPTRPSDEALPDFLTGEVEEKKPEPPVEDVKIESVGLKELRNHYKTLKETSKTQLETLKRELDEAKKAVGQTPADAEAKIQELEQKNQELSDALEQGYVENHPAIRHKYVDGRNKEVEKAHRILNAVKVDPKMWDRAMSLPLESRIDALEEIHLSMPEAAKNILARSESKIDELDLEKEQALADRKGLREKLEQQDMIQKREAIQQHEKATLQLLDSAQKDLLERVGLEVLKKSDNPAFAKWNEGVDRRIADARKLMLEITDESTMARASILAASAMDYRQLYHMFRDRAIEAEKKLKAYDSAEPDLKDKGEETPKTDDKLTFAEAVAAAYPRR